MASRNTAYVQIRTTSYTIHDIPFILSQFLDDSKTMLFLSQLEVRCITHSRDKFELAIMMRENEQVESNTIKKAPAVKRHIAVQVV